MNQEIVRSSSPYGSCNIDSEMDMNAVAHGHIFQRWLNERQKVKKQG